MSSVEKSKKSKKSKKEMANLKYEWTRMNGQELLIEAAEIYRLSEGFVSSVETVETFADFRSLLGEYIEQRAEALKRIEELAQKNLRSLIGDAAVICDAVLPGLLPLR